MIRVLPDNDAGRVCRAMARLPEGVTCEQLSQHMYRQPSHPPIEAGRPKQVHDAAHMAAKAEKRRQWQRENEAARVAAAHKIGVLLRELTRAGYVEPLGLPRVAEWAITSPPHMSGGERAIVARLQAKPETRAELKLSGSGNRAYQRLVSAGVIVAPSGRVLSLKGRELVASWGES